MRLKQHQQQKRTTCKLVKQKTTKKLIKDSNFQASFQNLFSCQGYFSVQINSRTGEKIKTERFSVKLLTADHQRSGFSNCGKGSHTSCVYMDPNIPIITRLNMLESTEPQTQILLLGQEEEDHS